MSPDKVVAAIEAAHKALDEAKVPTKNRHGVDQDGNVRQFTNSQGKPIEPFTQPMYRTITIQEKWEERADGIYWVWKLPHETDWRSEKTAYDKIPVVVMSTPKGHNYFKEIYDEMPIDIEIKHIKDA